MSSATRPLGTTSRPPHCFLQLSEAGGLGAVCILPSVKLWPMAKSVVKILCWVVVSWFQ